MGKLLRISAGFIGVISLYATAHAEPSHAMPQLRMADACKAADAALAAQPLVAENVAVVDANGSLVCFKHQDGAVHGGVPGSIRKAVASAFFGISSAELEVKMGSGAWATAASSGKSAPAVPVPTLPGVAAASLPAPIYSQGAVPIIRDGVVDGAIGCGGGTAAQDEVCAGAGAAAISPPNRSG